MQIKIEENETTKRLDNFIVEAFFDEYKMQTGEILTRNIVQKNIMNGFIKVNSKVQKPSYKLKLNDIVDFEIKEKKEIIIKPKNIPLDIIFEDEDLIVLNKQKGLIVHPTSKMEDDSLVSALLFHNKKLSDIGGIIRQGIVHRLDRDTSGLMLIAKNNEAHIKLQKDIQDKKTIRKYLAVCYGVIEDDFGTIDKPLIHFLNKTVKMNVAEVGQNAVTHFRVIERFELATFLELQLETGRTHQIRCHLSSINHPLVGDNLYGAKGFQKGIFKTLKTKGQVLMSYYLSFTHPMTGEIMEFMLDEKKYHPDLTKTLNLLRSIS